MNFKKSLIRRAVLPLAAVTALSGSVGCRNDEIRVLEEENSSLRQELVQSGRGYNEYVVESNARRDSLQSVIGDLQRGIATRDFIITYLREEPHVEAKPVATVRPVEKPTWRYNNSYDFFDESENKDERVDAFNVNKGNTIAGGILELAKKEGKKLTPKQAYDLSDNVSVWRKGKEVKVDPARLQIGDVVDFRGTVQEAIYGPKLEQRVAETVVPFDQLTSVDLDGNGEINYQDLGLFMERYSDEPQARAVNPCWDSDTPNRTNNFDFYPLISKFGEEDKVTTEDGFRTVFERYKAGEFDCGEDKPEGDGVKRNLILVGLSTLTPEWNSVAVSYDRFLNNGLGVGYQTANFDGDPMLLGRLSFGGDNYRTGIGVGHIYTDDKTAIAMEPFLQFRLPQSKDAYGEIGVGISDVGRWKDQLDGNGYNSTREYGFVGLKVGKRF